ncbi:MAG: hypothetical protein AAB885_01870 [Patescibacteria group bacterium]
MDNFFKILKSLHKIQPDLDYKATSRRLILVAPQSPKLALRFGIFESFKLGAAITLASVLTFIVIGGISLFQFTKVSPGSLTSFDSQDLTTEALSLDLKIQLGDAKYFDDSTQDVAAVLDKVSGDSDKDIQKLLDEIIL